MTTNRHVSFSDILLSILGLVVLIPIALVIFLFLLVEVSKNLLKNGRMWK